MMLRWAALLLMSATLTACGTTTTTSGGNINPNAEGRKYRGVVKIGKPYYVNGKWYYPRYDEDYDEVGIASWYGPGFHGSKTANGEVLDTHSEYTAAHPTLPLPSVVRVTNLSNNKTLDVRLSDRGPFKEGRIIDLSKKSAQKLGIVATGTAQVRVQYLKKETEALWKELELTTEASKVIAAHSFDSKNLPAADAQEGGLFDAAGGRQVTRSAPIDGIQTADLPGTVKAEHRTSARPNILSVVSDAEAAEPAPQPQSYATKSGAVTMERLSAPPAKAEGGYIQAAAFGQKDNAYRAAKQLSPVAPANVVPMEMTERTLYRVRLGPFADAQARQQALQKVTAMGYGDARLVTE